MSSVSVAGAPATPTHTVHVQVSFHTADMRRAQAVAAKLIDSAHEIANLPECECDVDVSVETSSHQGSPASADASGAPPHERPPKS